ncbi:MAG: hypothetical protein J2P53_02910, partial [Bradyrhizobiaceae bacterium]|nr:hypothetical protein [Bradyrhizobiaceae bacterium]
MGRFVPIDRDGAGILRFGGDDLRLVSLRPARRRFNCLTNSASVGSPPLPADGWQSTSSGFWSSIECPGMWRLRLVGSFVCAVAW